MENSIRKFLEFNGRTIYFLRADGTYWVAVKPICEAIGVQYERQFKNIKEDEILSQLLSEQTMVAADNRLRKMVCLPEKYVYGWLFAIRSESPGLREYRQKCYDVLYDYFHGTLTQRRETLTERTEIDHEIERLEKQLVESEPYRKLQECRMRKRQIGKQLAELDRRIVDTQLSLF